MWGSVADLQNIGRLSAPKKAAKIFSWNCRGKDPNDTYGQFLEVRYPKMRLLLFTSVPFVLAILNIGSAVAQGSNAKLRACLQIDDVTKERLDCYDAVVRPEPKEKPAKPRTVQECRFLREEDERLVCFNGFVSRSKPAAETPSSPRARPK
jgi:hypothetical protein